MPFSHEVLKIIAYISPKYKNKVLQIYGFFARINFGVTVDSLEQAVDRW